MEAQLPSLARSGMEVTLFALESKQLRDKESCERPAIVHPAQIGRPSSCWKVWGLHTTVTDCEDAFLAVPE